VLPSVDARTISAPALHAVETGATVGERDEQSWREQASVVSVAGAGSG